MVTDTLILFGVTAAGLVAFAVVMGRREKAAITAMGASNHFQVKGFEATIDRARHEVHISVEGHAQVFRAPLGHLVAEHKVETAAVPPSNGCPRTVWARVETGKTWVRLLAVCLPVYYAQHWSARKERQTHVLTDAMDVTLPNSKARAFELWLDHHKRELFPDRAAVRATWDQTCAELLRACRQQRDDHGNAAMAFETWSFSAQPAIAYLVIEADGAVFWASGDTPMLEPVDRPRFKLAGDRLTVFSGDDHRSFPVPAERMAALQALRRRGVVRMG
jgi:hypothetical protein